MSSLLLDALRTCRKKKNPCQVQVHRKSSGIHTGLNLRSLMTIGCRTHIIQTNKCAAPVPVELKDSDDPAFVLWTTRITFRATARVSAVHGGDKATLAGRTTGHHHCCKARKTATRQVTCPQGPRNGPSHCRRGRSRVPRCYPWPSSIQAATRPARTSCQRPHRPKGG